MGISWRSNWRAVCRKRFMHWGAEKPRLSMDFWHSSIFLAISISRSLSSSGTRPISWRYIRTGSS